jgi:hypothetical protein
MVRYLLSLLEPLPRSLRLVSPGTAGGREGPSRIPQNATAVASLPPRSLRLLVSVEPMRAHVWSTLGQQCGTAAARFPSSPVAPDYTSNEVCLQTAWHRCQPAALTYVQNGLDTQMTITLVIEPAVPALAPCAVAASWVNNVDGGAIWRSGVEPRASVDYENDGLYARPCGLLGTFVMPRT